MSNKKRKTRFTSKLIHKIIKMLLEGMTLNSIADQLEIPKSSIYWLQTTSRYKAIHTKLSNEKSNNAVNDTGNKKGIYIYNRLGVDSFELLGSNSYNEIMKISQLTERLVHTPINTSQDAVNISESYETLTKAFCRMYQCIEAATFIYMFSVEKDELCKAQDMAKVRLETLQKQQKKGGSVFQFEDVIKSQNKEIDG